MKNAYFAAGCFWCITPSFYDVKGVSRVISGYSGGNEKDPDYLSVKHQQTGHRETVCVVYDETAAGYDTLLDVFLGGIDPNDDGGQFIDRGHSYTTAVYWTDEAERAAAERKLTAAGATAVALEPFTAFYPAEEEHQDYFRKHPAEFEREMTESGRRKHTEE